MVNAAGHLIVRRAQSMPMPADEFGRIQSWRLRLWRRNCDAALAAIAAAAVLFAGYAHAGQTTLLETGSSLLDPLLKLWVADYQKIHPDVRIVTQSTGSGTGIAEAISGRVQIGASDAYIGDTQMEFLPGVLNIPLAVSSQMINYNIPGLRERHLNLSGPVLAGIYQGIVRYWDDPAIAGMNAGVKLPHKAIVPLHRTDGSGDTFVFTQYLTLSAPAWAKALGYGTTMNWPAVPGAIGAERNTGMVDAAKETPYSIAYIGISYKSETDAAGFGEARLKNRDGQFVLPQDDTVGAAVRQMAPHVPAHERFSLIFAPGAQSYPIVNFEYAIVHSHQQSAEIAEALREFLDWAIDPERGNASRYMQAVGFVPLPAAIVGLSRKQIDAIQ